MDAFARGLKTAAAIKDDGVIDGFIKERYGSWDSGTGADIETGKMSMADCSDYVLKKGKIAANASGRVEMLENIVNEYI